MRFEIELQKAEFFSQEPMPLKFRLVNDQQSWSVPLEYKSSDVITIGLYNAAGELLQEADGYTRTTRFGDQAQYITHNEMNPQEIPSGQVFEWEEDLQSYIDLRQPGHYTLKARFRFDPDNNEVESNSLEFDIMPHAVEWMDLLTDQAALNMAYLLQCGHKADSGFAWFKLTYGDAPESYNEGAELRLSPGSKPYIAKNNFAVHDTFEHAYFKWLVWLDSNKLYYTAYDEEKPFAQIFEYPVNLKNPALLSRPIQTKEKGVNVLLKEDTGGGKGAIISLNFDRQGQPVGQSTLGDIDFPAVPLKITADWNQNLYLVAGQDGFLPLRMAVLKPGGNLEFKDIIKPSDLTWGDKAGQERNPKILYAAPDIQSNAAQMAAVLSVLFLSVGNDYYIKCVRIPIANDSSSKAIQVQDHIIPKDKFEPGENIIAAHAVQIYPGEIHTVLMASSGNLYYLDSSGGLLKAAKANTSVMAQSRLVETVTSDIYLAYPDGDKGVGYVQVLKSFRP